MLVMLVMPVPVLVLKTNMRMLMGISAMSLNS
jgi:hypothetical protein